LGGAMRNTSLSSPNLTNCILWANMASSGSQIHNSDSAPVVTYCDIQDGHSGAGNIDLDPLFVRNPGPGPDGMWRTEDDDPGDLRLRLISPCIDAGKNSAAPTGILTDKAGNPRFVDVPASADTGSGTAPLVDMGAYEAPAALQAVDGGPYRVVEGCSIVLAGAGYSPTGRAVSYAWDFNGDGQFDDATGPTPVFSAAGILGPHTLTIALRVTDTSDATAVDTTVLRVLRPDYYVDDSAAGLNNGTSWADAYTGLQPALAAAVPGQVIAVAQGTYKPTAGTDRTGTFSLKGGVALYGGFAGHGAPGPSTRDVGLYLSILSGDIGTARSTADNSYHVVTASGTDPTAVLDGFAITAGTADGSSENAFGGGMYIGGGSPTLTNCTFIASSAGFGGGMYSTASSPTLTNCTFIANSASSGGGMYNNSSSPTLTDCTFIANSAGSGGGMSNDFSHTALTNCAFAANAATYGGGMYSNYSWPTLANCILWANTAPTGSQIFAGGGASVVTYSDIHGGYSGAGNKNLDPQFVRNPGPGPDGTWRTADDDYGDLRLRPSSPCIDAGNNSAVPTGISTDLAGNPRFADVPAVADTGSGTAPIVDMGAYESPNPNLVLGGTDGPDEFSLSQSPDQASIRIVGPGGSNTYSVLAITAITVNGGQGDDRLTVDFGNGNPVPTGGVTFDGQGGSDSVRIVAPGNNATLNGEQVSVGTAAPIGFSNTEGTSFDLGTGRLTKAGSSAAVLVGGSTYAGGTEVLGGTLVVGQANALPAGGGLTIGAGATVVLPSGLIQAVADEPGSAVAQDQTGGGQWQVDSGQWTVDSPLSTVHCLPATVHGLPSTVQPRASLCSSAPTLQHSLPTTIARRHAFDVVMRSMDAQGWQQLVLVTTGQQAARKMKGCRWGEIALNEAHDPML
jgi:autotransporter-associated beta strand protein